VTGIVEKERNTAAYEKAYGDIPRMYMSYYGYMAASAGTGNNITVLEAAIPNPVKDFARNIFDKAVRINEDTMVVRENSSRYTFFNRCRIISTLPFMGMRTDQIIYPYFENELQATDFFVALWMLGELICGGIAAAALLTSVICLFSSGFSVTGILKLGLHKAGTAITKYKNSKNRKQRLEKRKVV